MKYFMPVLLLICFSITYSYAQGFKYHREIEVRNFNLSLSKNYINTGGTLMYRQFFSDQFSINVQTGLSTIKGIGIENNTYSFYQTNLGLGFSYFMNKERKGLNFGSTFKMLSNFKKSSSIDHQFALEAYIGYRFNFGKGLFLNTEMRGNYYFNQKNLYITPNITLGIKF